MTLLQARSLFSKAGQVGVLGSPDAATIPALGLGRTRPSDAIIAVLPPRELAETRAGRQQARFFPNNPPGAAPRLP